MISKATLRRFKRLSEKYMDCLCSVYNPTNVRLPGGVSTQTYALAEEGVECRLTTIDPPHQVPDADQLRSAARWAVTLPLGTPVTDKSRLTVTGTDLDGNDFSVTIDVAEMEAPKSFMVHLKVIGTLVPTDGT